jgi:L-lactate dehydrogenase complex protein LldG
VTARQAILKAVRAARPPAVDLPGPASFINASGDVVDRFTTTATAAGAVVIMADRAEIARVVAARYPMARRVLSVVQEVQSTVDVPRDAHALADLDLFVAEGVLGVAENGAVWLPDSRLPHRAAPFIAEHLTLILARATIVPHLHAAYSAVDAAAESFGVFIAGPSKTADIEQALVIGAHGPTSLTIVLVE